MGNRIFGCDDCQLVCPWNKYAQRASLPDFDARAQWSDPALLELWQWDEAAFMRHTEGSALRRIGFARWRRNLAVALGNALRVRPRPDIERALRAALPTADDLLHEHVLWALEQSSVRDSTQR
jgi:epoxyqueuosine reductase